MSYIALARKWRPRTFAELIGQEHINKALIHSLQHNRLHHAYLFTGTRGVGKTSVARLLAKALNCEQGLSATPCLTCNACIAIEQGCFVDLIEIDGASRTRVEDTRELLDNVQYAPTSGRFKIYLIDEVHMLSQHSFNALLKTLEEPPEHVKFLLATTDPQKLPITVLSRCLQFHLKHVPADAISLHLETILHAESLPFEKEALDLLALAARGSIRDALSLLDQAIASCDDKLEAKDIKSLLGYTQQNYALQLLQALATNTPQQLMTISKEIGAEGGQYHYVVDELLSYLHQINIHQMIPNTPMLNQHPDTKQFCNQFSPEDIQLLYEIGLKGSEDMHLAPTIAIGFEMMLLRMYAFRPAPPTSIPPLAFQNEPTSLITETTALTSALKPLESTSIDIAPSPNRDNIMDDTSAWNALLPTLQLSGLALSAIEHAEFTSKEGNIISLRVDKRHQSLFTSAVITRIEQGLANHYQDMIKLTVIADDAVLSTPAQKRKEENVRVHALAADALQSDPFFQQLQQEFSAQLVKNSIEPLKEDI